MSDITDTTATDTTETAETTEAAETETATEPTTDLAAELAKWKAQARENEKRAKANADKAKQYDAFEEANKTELQKAQDRAAALEQRATAAELKATKSEIARTKGVPVELLSGTTQDEIEAAADALIAFRGQQPAAARVGGADVSGGAAKPQTFTREQLRDPAFFQTHKADILAAERNGRITS